MGNARKYRSFSNRLLERRKFSNAMTYFRFDDRRGRHSRTVLSESGQLFRVASVVANGRLCSLRRGPDGKNMFDSFLAAAVVTINTVAHFDVESKGFCKSYVIAVCIFHRL